MLGLGLNLAYRYGVEMPFVINFAVFGDSRASQTGSDTTSFDRLFSNGIGYWFHMRTGSKLNLIINSEDGDRKAFSQGGQTWASLNDDNGSYPRVAQLISAAPAGTVILCYCGTNGIPNGASNIADAKTVISRFKNAGLRPIFFVEPYFGASQIPPLYVSERDTYNSEMISWCNANSIPICNVKPWYDNGSNQSYDYMFIDDGGYIHPNIRGASIVGREFAKAIESLFRFPDFPITYANTSSAINANRAFTTGAYGNGGSTGFASGTTNATLSTTFIDRTDGQTGKWARMVVTNAIEGGATSGVTGSAKLYCALSSTNRPADGTYKLVCEIEVEEWLETPASSGYTNLRQINLKLSTIGGTDRIAEVGYTTSSISLQAHTLGERQSYNPVDGLSDKRFALITGPMDFLSDNTHMAAALTISGNCILKITNLSILPIT